MFLYIFIFPLVKLNCYRFAKKNFHAQSNALMPPSHTFPATHTLLQNIVIFFHFAKKRAKTAQKCYATLLKTVLIFPFVFVMPNSIGIPKTWVRFRP